MHKLSFAKLADRRAHHHIAITRLRPGRLTQPHTQDFPEFFLVSRGEANHRCNGDEQIVQRGALVFVGAGDHHHYHAGPEGLELVNLAVAAGWWERFRLLFTPPLDPGKAPGGTRDLSAEAATQLEERLHDLLRRREQDAGALVAVLGSLADAWLGPCGVPSSFSSGHEPPEWLRRVVEEMHDPARLPQPLAYWHRRSGRSPEHVTRSCRRFLGSPLSEVLNRARIVWVKDQLRRGEDKIAVLALDAGYQNLGYFYRVFRRQEGCAPRAWLARHGGPAVVPR